MNNLKDRTRRFALDLIRFCIKLPQTPEFWTIRRQFIRCATSVGANYRSACRAKSKADFISKLSTVEEEADESVYWIELLEALNLRRDPVLQNLKKEASEITAIMVASKKTARKSM